MPDIRPFISYAREDRDTARRIASDLRLLGCEPWIDVDNLLPGDEWKPAIHDAIGHSSHFVALISCHSVDKRGFVQRELRQALELLDEFPPGALFVIPVRLDNTTPKHIRLRQLHWVDLFADYVAGIGRVARSLGLSRQHVLTAAGSIRPSLPMQTPGLIYRSVHVHTTVLDSDGHTATTDSTQVLRATQPHIRTLVTRGISGSGKTINHRSNLGPAKVVPEGGVLTVYVEATKALSVDRDTEHVLTYESIDCYCEPVESFGQNISRELEHAGVHVTLPPSRPFKWAEGYLVASGGYEATSPCTLSEDCTMASLIVDKPDVGARQVLRWEW
jgi:hypothetical protein